MNREYAERAWNLANDPRDWKWAFPQLEALFAEHERRIREECAKIAEGRIIKGDRTIYSDAAEEIAAMIRNG